MQQPHHDRAPPQFRLRHNFHLLVKNVLTTSLILTPSLACAVGIGEVVLQSRLGEPLRVRVELQVDSAEHIDSACLSLAKPGSAEDQSSYLTRAQLSYRAEAGRQYVEIRTKEPFNEPFALMQLQVKCPGLGMGAITKTITILPDLPNENEPSQFAAISTPKETEEAVQPPSGEAIAPSTATSAVAQTVPATVPENTAQPTGSNTSPPVQTTPGGTSTATKQPPVATPVPQAEAQPNPASGQRNALESIPLKPSRASHKRHARSERTGRTRAFSKPAFRLKLSGSLLDESLIGKTDEKNRERLREQNKDLDADDQTASYLKLLHQVKLLQEELQSIKLELAKIKGDTVIAASSPEATSPLAALPVAASAPILVQELQHLPEVRTPVVTPSQPSPKSIGMRDIGYFIAELFLAALAILLGIRFFNRKEPEHIDGDLFQTQITKQAEPATAPAMQTTAPPPANVQPSASIRVPSIAKPITTSVNTYFPEPQPETTEADLLMEEAELYNIHGHPDKAVNVLGEIMQKYPDNIEARLLLLTIYSTSGKKPEFERAAQDLMKRNPDNETMQALQKLQRYLDRNNTPNTSEPAPEASPAKPMAPLDLDFDLPFEHVPTENAQTEHAPITDINFEIPPETTKLEDLNFDIPTDEPEIKQPKEKPGNNPNHEITVDLVEALLKEKK